MCVLARVCIILYSVKCVRENVRGERNGALEIIKTHVAKKKKINFFTVLYNILFVNINAGVRP